MRVSDSDLRLTYSTHTIIVPDPEACIQIPVDQADQPEKTSTSLMELFFSERNHCTAGMEEVSTVPETI